MAVLFHYRTMDVLCQLCSSSPSNDLTWLPNALSTITLHSRPVPIIFNSSKQSGTVGDTSTKFTDLSGLSKTYPCTFPTSLWLHKTSTDHHGRERLDFRSAKSDRGLRSQCIKFSQYSWNHHCFHDQFLLQSLIKILIIKSNLQTQFTCIAVACVEINIISKFAMITTTAVHGFLICLHSRCLIH